MGFRHIKLNVTAICFLILCPLYAQDSPRPRLLGISHIALFAHDYARSKNFYGEFLGYEQPYSLQNPDGSESMTFFKINERQYIELFPEKQAGSDRLSHISIETDDIEAMRRYLASKGVKVPEHATRVRVGNLEFNITDPAGHTVELVQYTSDGKTVQAKGKFLGPHRISDHMTHVGLIVTDLDPEYRFYTDVLGFKETWRGSSDGKTLSWINLKMPDSDDYVEFMLQKSEPGPDQRGVDHHMCLRVANLEKAVADLQSRSYFKSYGRTIDQHLGKNRKRQANLFDPDGTRVELMEPDTIDGKPTPPSDAPPPR